MNIHFKHSILIINKQGIQIVGKREESIFIYLIWLFKLIFSVLKKPCIYIKKKYYYYKLNKYFRDIQ